LTEAYRSNHLCLRDAFGTQAIQLKGPAMTAQTDPLIRGLNIRQAAAYWGVAPNTFKKLIDLGLAPPPLKLPGVGRAIFDRLELDRAMDAARSETAAA
jgi:hypothetical protein